MVPFVIAPASPPHSSLTRSSSSIETSSSRVMVSDGRFVRDGSRMKFWGVNLSFASCLPEPADAPRVAARLAAAGINSVRLHHLDNLNYPAGLWNPADPTQIDSQAFLRLDAFLHQLAVRGIYINLNLHVGRAHSQYAGLPDPGTLYDKLVGIYTPELIQAQKNFAQQLLNHVNPHRGLRYADDPAVAFVEISNENSLFMSGESRLRNLPPYYASLLQSQYNSWLRERYGSDDQLRAAWSGPGTEPLGPNLVVNGDFGSSQPGSMAPLNWVLEHYPGTSSTAASVSEPPNHGVRIDFSQADGTGWHIRFRQNGISLQKDAYYTLQFLAAAETSRTLECNVYMTSSPFSNLGLAAAVDVGPEWSNYTLPFVCRSADPNAQVAFFVGASSSTLYLANVTLRSGGLQSLAAGESLETTSVALFVDKESAERTVDRRRFLAETERDFYQGMRKFIRSDLSCGALVTGTSVYGPLGLYAQSSMDYIDSHGYWEHPQFPGEPQDLNNWTIEQKAMTDAPENATLFGIACQRLEGKPFTLSEYNHAAPNDYQAESVPMVAAMAAAQDWDGVWLYDYGNSSAVPAPQAFSGFFDIEQNPSKWGFVRTGAQIYLEGAMAPLSAATTARLSSTTEPLTGLTQLQGKYGIEMGRAVGEILAAGWPTLLTRRVSVAFDAGSSTTATLPEATALQWRVKNGRGVFIGEGPGAWVYTGHAGDFSEETSGRLNLTGPEFCAVTLSALEGDSLAESPRILVTACGRCENVGMSFSPDRRTVGSGWGTGPVHIEPVEGTLDLPDGDWTCQALGTDGLPRFGVPLVYSGETPRLTMSSQYETIWYLLTRVTGVSPADYQLFD